MVSSGLLRRVALVSTDVSEDIASIIMVTRIGDLGTTLALPTNYLADSFHPDDG
jgi:hypothetical protein